MKLNITVRVWLKGVDLVAQTAFLTLVDKLGYANTLLALKRCDSYALTVDCEDPPGTLARFNRLCATRTIFYNRNKHSYRVRGRWDGGRDRDGDSLDVFESQLALEAARYAKSRLPQDLDSQEKYKPVKLERVPAYRVEVLVEDREPTSTVTVSD